jgi:uncharacterized membrane protein
VNKYGSRPVMIAGGCLSGCGLMAASFCNTVQELYLCIGVIGGELLLVLFCAVVYYLLFEIYLLLAFRYYKLESFLIEIILLPFEELFK